VFAASANSSRGTPGSLPTENDTLTPERAAALGHYRARWVAIRRSTAPANRSAAEEGVRLAYRAAGLQPPAHFVWCESPIALAHLTRRIARADGTNVKTALLRRQRRQVASLVRRRLPAHVRAAVTSGVNSADSLVASANDATTRRVARHTGPLLERIRRSRALSWDLRTLFGLSDLYEAAGQHEFAWLGAYEYLREVLGLRSETEPLRGLMQLAKNLGWMQPHQHTCWLVERPNLLCGDARGRLHNAQGPALRYPDDWCVWAWKDVEVPSWMIEQPERITLDAIDCESDVQVRRCMIEIITPQRYVALGGPIHVAEDESGVLWRKVWHTFDAWAVVEVVNATPEPDGTRKHFFLQVPAHMRTAREAVAWTYGMSEHAYSRLIVRT
jgi:hypothetical protein